MFSKVESINKQENPGKHYKQRKKVSPKWEKYSEGPQRRKLTDDNLLKSERL